MSPRRDVARADAVKPSKTAAAGESNAAVAQIRAGDAATFETLVRAQYAPLVVFAQRLVGAKTDAEDVVQDVFVRIWVHRDTWEVHETVQAYLYASVRNRALNWIRDRRRADARTSTEYSTPLEMAPATDGVLRSADGLTRVRDLDAALARAIDALPDRCRQVYTLRSHHGLSREETATVLGVSLKTVENQTTRAFHLLREALADFF